jgi:hypothetical protein
MVFTLNRADQALVGWLNKPPHLQSKGHRRDSHGLQVESGKAGWGQKSMLDLDLVRSMASAQAAKAAPAPAGGNEASEENGKERREERYKAESSFGC